ncbi:hypothetical protein ASPFODRAFT_70125 [Aspergillus luchuensis CBS 106.47]|uniref:Uncharacterized protein n=1 Tax=Aspergillus luchuensis (strain CBS 106.47) TaxID=1137211 RepID=A0A1M3TK74_ASPLC|nr:hypothetical protein ASPFODRAFT_70125 [Aspergillus luchuensis CBS 106.47]
MSDLPYCKNKTTPKLIDTPQHTTQSLPSSFPFNTRSNLSSLGFQHLLRRKGAQLNLQPPDPPRWSNTLAPNVTQLSVVRPRLGADTRGDKYAGEKDDGKDEDENSVVVYSVGSISQSVKIRIRQAPTHNFQTSIVTLTAKLLKRPDMTKI